MAIILDEYEWVENCIREKQLGSKPLEALARVARYYYANKFTKKEIRKRLDTFLIQCDPNASLIRWSDTLDKIARNVGKYKLIKLDGIDVFQSEIDTINALQGMQLKRFAFTLLCTSKYWDAVTGTNSHWVNTKDNEIMEMANIDTSIKRQCKMFSDLRDLGLIRFSKKVDNLNVQVLFSIDSGEQVLRVQDFRNLGYQYMRLCGGKFFECSECGIVLKEKDDRRGPKQKYCASCAAKIRIEQSINSINRRRYENQRKNV